MSKAVLTIDYEETSSLLSGLLLLQNEIELFLELSPEQLPIGPNIPSNEQMKESLKKVKKQVVQFENILKSLEKELSDKKVN